MSYLEPLPDQEPNPYAPPRAWLEPPPNARFRDHPRHARMIRIIGVWHFGIAVSFVCLLYSIHALDRDYPLETSGPRLDLSVFSTMLLPAMLNTVIGIGIWTFGRWSMQLATAQCVIVLAAGFLVGIYVLFHDGDFGGFTAISPGVFLFPFAAYLRHLWPPSSDGNSSFEPPAAQ